MIKAKCSPYLKRGKPALRPQLVNETDLRIIQTFGAEYRGLTQYYLLAGDVYRLTKVHRVMQLSMLRTLARKYRSTTTRMAVRYQAVTETPYGPRRCFEAVMERDNDRKPLVARFGGIPLKQQKRAVIVDRVASPIVIRNKELIKRLMSGRCEVCKQKGEIRVRQIRSLADRGKSRALPPEWVDIMVKRRRKTIMVCNVCHGAIGIGKVGHAFTG